MAYETITVDKDGPAFIITFNRPAKRNAISTVTMGEMMAAAADAEDDADIRGIIITGGTDFFSAGADLNDAQALSAPAETLTYLKRWHRLCRTFEEHNKPVIAAIEGFCMTGGCEFAMACDIRVGAEGSSYAITSARIGTVAGAGGTQRLPRIVGPAKALEIMFDADPIVAEEAYRIGLINKLVPKGSALDEARSMVAHYATRAPLSHAFIKHTVYTGMQMDLVSSLDYESFIVSTIYETEDRREGIGAFLEKRKAEFKGK
ncbi:MAG: enoyl-CoA hydratase/isomerase family protein [Rhodospirillaceae bacterium]|jgi:enoyl-CoA hydratase/carnithine racemase|nr:enoyl-CoA hydratase/isomerase family protein [Rhodospirillaceae bacterium]MBT3911002.1 enoyl-CoA hydratase/isomerase family protein [Rhodospirillaceae bacterium]MBT5297020.1 enoyl-CoA hydratase/isomerase family protein [Rhodospirillaceae bacterium]MBT5516250.1 enoyl-CoA hydratase/isomerase family protein [Rhodospirillaceae bacterium]MBT6085271.1 enoyl-CoA hydratase/isomerase family protein [Rhodospirillaceae bacterium]